MSTSTTDRPRSGLAVGFIVFAGVAMVMIGAFHALQGLVALFNDESTWSARNGSSSST